MMTDSLNKIFTKAENWALSLNQNVLYPEHILIYLIEDPVVAKILKSTHVDAKLLRERLIDFTQNKLEVATINYPITLSLEANRLLAEATYHLQSLKLKEVPPYLFFLVYFNLDKFSYANYFLAEAGADKEAILNFINQRIINSNAYKNPGVKESDKSLDFLTNLNDKAKKDLIDPIIGRSNEIERLIQTIIRRKKSNAVLVGEAGVGKTAIIEGLALKIVNKEVPLKLQNYEVYSLELGSLVAGTKYRGDFEEKVQNLITKITSKKEIILFIDEIHTLLGAGGTSQGGLDFSNMLKPLLASGELKVVGATTYKEYRNYFEKDSALARRFQKIDVEEPSRDETIDIISNLKTKFEQHHEVTYTDDAISKAVDLSILHIRDRFLPDKAIDLLDEAGSIQHLKKEKIVNSLTIESLVSKILRIPEKTLSSNQEDKLRNLETELKLMIFGQDHAIEQVANSVLLSKSGLRNNEKPIASFLFTGPTGVGKTELAKQLASSLNIDFTRFDMSEFMEKHSVSKFIGAPPGYVGFDQEGLLTSSVSRKPHSVILLDEIEKAHPDVLNILLQILDHGTLTDSTGKKFDFRNTIVIMTSNVGSKEFSKNTIGIAPLSQETEGSSIAVSKAFSPEFRNRLDGIIYFHKLSEPQVVNIANKFLAELDAQLLLKNVSLEIDEPSRLFIAKKGFDPALGARPMYRAIQSYIKEPLSKEILFGKLKNGGSVKITFKEDNLKIQIKEATKKNEKSKV